MTTPVSDPPVDFRRTRSGWQISIPQALVVAAVTALSTGATTRCSAIQAPAADIANQLTEIRDLQRKTLDRVNEVDQASRNRDVIQDARIDSLRDRR